jgi:hypothetical protein
MYAAVRQGTDDELSSSPAGRDALARIGTMTGSNLAASGKAAWAGTSTAGRVASDGQGRDGIGEYAAINSAIEEMTRLCTRVGPTSASTAPTGPGRSSAPWCRWRS